MSFALITLFALKSKNVSTVTAKPQFVPNIFQHPNRSFVAEMSFFVKQLGRTIHGRDTGSNKQSASKSCALSIVRQLYHLNVIEAFTGTLKKDKSGNEMQPYEVKISPELELLVKDALKDLNITPVAVPETPSDQPVSLLSTQVHSLTHYAVLIAL